MHGWLSEAKCLIKSVLLLGSTALLSACLSTEPRTLSPTITLSAENELLAGNDGSAQNAGVSFGLTGGVNESDSLTNVSVLPGIRVRAVTPAGSAERAGIRAGDVILAVDGTETNHPDMLDALALQTREETTFNFEVRRNTTVFQASVTVRPVLENQSAPVELYRADPLLSRAGYSSEWLQTANGERVSGARLVRVFAQSPLPAAGLRVNDIIFAVDGQSVSSAQGLVSLLNNQYQPGDRVTLSVSRNNVVSAMPVTLWDPGRRLTALRAWPLFSYQATQVPDASRLNIGDLILFSLFTYERNGPERSYSVLGLIRSSSGLGELAEE
ncbi:PDZ domain-containing protein [Gammaproteobacteria bacterium LSUCC0112]|nr:PDZ domain-containing protein [Gammaproteobacteria bacterium LSUCC0112]